MSIDIYLKSQKGPFKISPDELKAKLENDFDFIEIYSEDPEIVGDFEVKPKNMDNPEGITYTFHVQPEGHLWHPAPGRSSESIKLGVDVLELVSKLLDLEIEYSS